MDGPKPTRPWWKQKRWIATAALLLIAGYPASLGPVDYAVARGWLRRGDSGSMETGRRVLANAAWNALRGDQKGS